MHRVYFFAVNKLSFNRRFKLKLNNNAAEQRHTPVIT